MKEFEVVITEYKWTVLINTSLGVIMSSMNMNILMISLPAIFRGLGINPFAPGEFAYLLWVLMGYSIILATILVTLGRISDMHGRERAYTLGFIIFSIASIALSFIPSNSGNFGALILIILRMVQAIGGGLLMVNSTALITDAFPLTERGKALGLNQVMFIVGTFLGLIAGGLVVGIDWHMVFILSVPFGVAGSLWSVFKLRKTKGTGKTSLDIPGNVTLAGGLLAISLGLTYALMPYGNSQMGWGNPWVITAFIIGVALFIVFVEIEKKAKAPLFQLSLFKIRPFTYGLLALFFNALARGAVMFLITIWLQGIYLPLHGYSWEETPFWAGIYMIPMMLGMVVMAPFSGILTDKYGARTFATLGMIIIAITFYGMTLLPYNFDRTWFEILLFINGLGNGLFSAPNTTAIMNALSSKDRAAGNGMRQTFNNIGSSISMAIFFTILLTFLSKYLPTQISTTLSSYGLPQEVIKFISSIPVSGLLFGAFLGVDPASAIPSSLISLLPSNVVEILNSRAFLPTVLGPSFKTALTNSLYISIALVLIGAVFSYMRGGRYVIDEEKGATAKT
ncbi:major facilitator superfamily MFS_1 [Fervidicoccus fontis Kam940]|uniref:Major facilitator superfamily MFS_1 n=1 Tax=Fervidicoccus fontis (strain DSM 19380 / JCM 18336 / VKM B-2539 / Kam940) TaxID=1163730 RepID=I0A1L3_FERFK|nr:major facilitator superfamily MFS_1 [Fervidicoccus fontis Kam940]